MVESHEISFFGQKSAIILGSGKFDGPIFLNFLKVKDNTEWEKPSLKEGIVFSLGLLEIKKLLDTIQFKSTNELVYTHKYKEITRVMKIKIEYDPTTKIVISVGDHLKPLVYPESAVFEDLLAHIYQEKLIFGTEKKWEKKDETPEITEPKEEPKPKVEPKKETIAPPKQEEGSKEYLVVVRALSAKALQLEFPSMNNKLLWAPLSKINEANPDKPSEIALLGKNDEITLKIPSWIVNK